ncbi:MAG: sodium-dependent transporter [Bacteroidales bacterium]|nr:sodium-dependent transporter [Bacteroidales bacterium]
MQNTDHSPRDGFGSKIGTIAAVAGSAVGLGNIWRFPYITGENGGAAFILVYVFIVLFIGIPVMLSEFTIGRRAQRNAFGAFRLLAPRRPWYLVGVMGIAAAFMILAFYSTVAGWTFEYLRLSLVNGFKGKSPEELNALFENFYTGGWRPVIWQVVVMLLTGGILLAGVRKGIEKYTKILMPMLLVLLVILAIRSITLPGAMQGLNFLFRPDFSKIDASTILEALGQAFFSMSIGMGTIITYGSYIRKKDRLSETAFSVAGADLAVALLAGIAILPAVFAFGIAPSEGPGLVFITLPNIFQHMPGGYFWALMFFTLLIIAALTSTISVMEVVVAFISEEFSLRRRYATIIATIGVTFLGVLCTLSQGPYPQFSLFGRNLFDLMNFSTANIMLPTGGLFIVIFVGWFLGRKNVRDEISNGGTMKVRLFNIFLFLVRFIAPLAIAMVFLNGLGILKL